EHSGVGVRALPDALRPWQAESRTAGSRRHHSPGTAAGAGGDEHQMDTRLPENTRLTPRLILTLAVARLPSAAPAQPRYSATQIGDVVQLRDARTDTIVSV